MTLVPLATGDFPRTFGDLPPALLKNRIFESNPSQAAGNVMLARPGNAELGSFGTGPIRSFYSLPGLFDGSVFFISGETAYRREVDGTTIAISGLILGTGYVSMTGVEGIGYERIFFADGARLQMYQGGTHATGVLTLTGHVADLDYIEINTTYYQWVDTVTTGDGTVGNPIKVLRGADAGEDLENMVKALGFVGTPGVDWSANLGGQNTDVTAVSDPTTMTVTAKLDTAVPNAYTTTEMSSVASWAAGLLSGGGTHALSGVEIPDGQPPVSVTTLKSYILVAIGESDRWYYIRPAAVIIDPLDFFTAESHPDNTLFVSRVGDTAWFVGEASTEIWYATGDSDDPFRPVTGRVYDRGAIEGTVVNIKGVIYLVAPDNIVYAISGSPQRISNHGIEELIRTTIGAE